jgi:RNA polymerase-associated protein RTF1
VKKDSDESSFGDDDDDDSDDDYNDGTLINKPWHKKSEDKPTTVSKLDRTDDYDEENDGAGAKGDTTWGDDAAANGPVEEADLESFLKITLPRRRLARWCNEPFFKEAVIGCFVKLFVGENEEGKRCYRLCRIVSVKSENPYELPKIKNEKPVSDSSNPLT